MQIDYTIGTVISIKQIADGLLLDIVDRCLYDHAEDRWEDIIKRSHRVKRFAVSIKNYEVFCDDARIKLGLEARIKRNPEVLTACGFTFKLAS